MFKNLWLIRKFKDLKRRYKRGRTYEHFSSNINGTLSQQILESRFVNLRNSCKDNRVLKLPLTAIYHLRSHRESDEVMIDLASRFIKSNNWVQYTSCTRHPIEFLTSLESFLNEHNSGSDWEKLSQRIVVVDACTPHFGYTDSIYEVRKDNAKEMCLEVIESVPSFAGIHTANARAFNHIKKFSKGTRGPTLIIYEGLHSLVDMESHEQYRIFFSHVLPSERLWGGMFTVVIEFSPTAENLEHIRTHGDYFYATCRGNLEYSARNSEGS